MSVTPMSGGSKNLLEPDPYLNPLVDPARALRLRIPSPLIRTTSRNHSRSWPPSNSGRGCPNEVQARGCSSRLLL